MKMDYSLIKLTNFFTFSLCILEKLLKAGLQFVLHWRNQLTFSSRCSTKNFMLEKLRFYVKYLSSCLKYSKISMTVLLEETSFILT